MRGYFGIGVEGVSKTGNLGSLFRSAHAFGASFAFVVAPDPRVSFETDTSEARRHMPCYRFDSLQDLALPAGCELVGVELIDEAVELPSFHHPRAAAYVMGPEKGSLSPAMLERCDHVVRIPTAFCLNLAIAGAVVMYDRVRSLGGFRRPVSPHGGAEQPPLHVHGGRFRRRPNKRPPVKA
jgi:tRNA G18 (ribose-2'-O)-methylase SpoU